jgi:hypothetical protein
VYRANSTISIWAEHHQEKTPAEIKQHESALRGRKLQEKKGRSVTRARKNKIETKAKNPRMNARERVVMEARREVIEEQTQATHRRGITL